MNFGDLVFATSPETGMFYGIYAGEDRCWKYCTSVQELINQDVIRCTSIKLAEGWFGGNWFEQQGKQHFTYRFKKVKPKGYEPKFQPGDLVECIEGNLSVLKDNFYRVVESYPHPLTGARFVMVKRGDGTEREAYERRFVLVPKGDRWSFEINNGVQVNGSEIAENLTRKKPIIYHTGAVEGKAFFEIHTSFIFKWQQLEDLWDEAHQYLTIVRDYETYRRYITDLSNIDKLLHIFRAVKKHPWPADGSGRRKVEVFRPVL
jgi:hypothetical protein